MKKPKSKTPVKYPKGWNQKTIHELAEHYEKQSEAEAAAEDEAAWRSTRTTMMAVPVKLVPKVQKMIAKMAR
jgi:response regulator of citrate/malate metabolism